MTRYYLQLLALIILVFFITLETRAEEVTGNYSKLDLKVKTLAFNCRDEVVAQFKALLTTKTLTVDQLFDTFYIPIPNTQPQKYQNAYDRITDKALKGIFDKYTNADPRIIYVAAVDRNGYLPTHNSKYSQITSNDPAYNFTHNRSKQIFNDQTGLAAAKNLKPFLLQNYNRDTGEGLHDLSVPVVIDDRHWGAIRIGYRQK